jgi:hypothetical protein
MTKTLASILLVALTAVSTALAGPYNIIPVASDIVTTNDQVASSTLNRKVGPVTATTVGVGATFKLMAAGTGTNHFVFQRSYDGTNDWETVLTVQKVAAGTSAVTLATNFTVADYGFVRCYVTNRTGGTTTNLVLNLYHK